MSKRQLVLASLIDQMFFPGAQNHTDNSSLLQTQMMVVQNSKGSGRHANLKGKHAVIFLSMAVCHPDVKGVSLNSSILLTRPQLVA